MTSPRLLIATLLLVAAALIVESRRAQDYTPTFDTAVIESYALLAADGALDVGAYSRFQWHHPGPLYFYLLAPFHQASGEKTAGLAAGALAINVASAFAIAFLLLRRNLVIAFATTVPLAAYAWRAAEALASPWNPHIAVLPFAALVVSAAAAMSGTPMALPLVAGLASLAAQAHVALAPTALALGAVAAGCVLAGPARMRALALTIAVLIVVWALPLKEQLTVTPGNGTLLWNYFVAESHPGQPFGVALSAWADMLTGVLRPDFYVAHGWKYVESPVKWAEALSLGQLLALSAIGFSAWRSGRRFELALSASLVGASLLALWSATRAEEPLFDHALFWIAGLGVLNLGMVVGEGMRLVSTIVRRDLPVRALSIGSAAALAALIVAGHLELRRLVAQSFAPGGESITAAALADDLAAYISAHGLVRPVIRIDQDAWGVVSGVVVNLQKRGVPVAIEDDWLVMFTPAFADTGQEEDAIAIVAPAEHVRLAGTPGNETIASRDPIYAHLIRLRP